MSLRKRMTRFLQNFFLVISSSTTALIGAEYLARTVLDPIDYIFPTLTADEFLTHRIQGYTGGHDEWGFRNSVRPEQAEIVCIGDSMTYGMAAPARYSWPAALGKIRGRAVYNMGLGGYGPIQYLHLLRTRALELRPKTVIVSLYFGNDFLDVYNAVRFNKNWSHYANLGSSEEASRAFVSPDRPAKFLGGLREWLSKHSLLYAAATRLEIFDFVRSREMAERDLNHVVRFQDDRHNVLFDLNPKVRFLDLRDPRIDAAMAITKNIFLEMREIALREHIRLIVTLVPTKERVYGNVLRSAGLLDRNPALIEAVQQEDMARSQIMAFLIDSNIELIDLLPALESGTARGDVYPAADGHPSKSGYQIIASAVSDYLDRSR